MLDIKGNEQIRRVYADDGISPTLNTMQGGNRQPKVLIPQATKQGYIECNVPCVADLSFPDSKTRRGRVQENGEICPTPTAGTQDICYINTPCIAASRGRNPENPSDRTVGSPTEQRLEINKNGTSNTITTVQKDNYVVEPNVKDIKCLVDNKPKLVGGIGQINFGKQYRQGNRIYDSEAIAMCLNAQPVGNTGGYSYLYKTDYRIRKLTPLEVWRLMGFTDEQFYKAKEVNSNSQLYKQAGNSICVDVLYYLFKNLFLENEV
jgi:DNA (cytosine-5)-methyltransferase 1